MYTDKDLKETMALHTRVLPQPCFGTLLLNGDEMKERRGTDVGFVVSE